jgi:tetratricopeptide (TPR) repeat protein
MRSLRGSGHIDVGSGLSNLARLEVDMGDLQAAETHYREALDIKREELGDDHEGVAITLYHLAVLLNRTGRYADAEPLCREALEIRQRRFEPTHAKVVNAARLLEEIQKNQ